MNFVGWVGTSILVVFGILAIDASAADDRSTADLSFLLGTWDVQWTYSPNTEDERSVSGSLECKNALNNLHIFCEYRFAREDAPPIIEHVYFSYNPIYEQYESIWISATWPIKVLMSGELAKANGQTYLDTNAEFRIANGVLEQVRSRLWFESTTSTVEEFSRETFIRTSDLDTEAWIHHMTASATRVE